MNIRACPARRYTCKFAETTPRGAIDGRPVARPSDAIVPFPKTLAPRGRHAVEFISSQATALGSRAPPSAACALPRQNRLRAHAPSPASSSRVAPFPLLAAILCSPPGRVDLLAVATISSDLVAARCRRPELGGTTHRHRRRLVRQRRPRANKP
jgi:hypothetical protein